KEKLRQFFLTYGKGDTPEAARQRANMARINIGGFKPADETHLLPVREMEATGQLVEARSKGDPAAMAKAQASLDAIKKEMAALPKG
ncbi:MAG: phosphate/phosphite/phosphonate ABC transporter substrate-binding protein, partial [Phenylobacterium sp.]